MVLNDCYRLLVLMKYHDLMILIDWYWLLIVMKYHDLLLNDCRWLQTMLESHSNKLLDYQNILRYQGCEEFLF